MCCVHNVEKQLERVSSRFRRKIHKVPTKHMHACYFIYRALLLCTHTNKTFNEKWDRLMLISIEFIVEASLFANAQACYLKCIMIGYMVHQRQSASGYLRQQLLLCSLEVFCVYYARLQKVISLKKTLTLAAHILLLTEYN